MLGTIIGDIMGPGYKPDDVEETSSRFTDEELSLDDVCFSDDEHIAIGDFYDAEATGCEILFDDLDSTGDGLCYAEVASSSKHVDDSVYTGHTVMTAAVAEWLMADEGHTARGLVKTMRIFSRRHPSPKGGYNPRLAQWLASPNPVPYGGRDCDVAVRATPVGLYARTLDEALDLAKRSAEVTHNHLESIRGAQAVATAVFLAKEGLCKEYIRKYIKHKFGYGLDRSVQEAHADGSVDGLSCQALVPVAVTAFLEGGSFDDVVRLAASVGDGSDAAACIAAAIAACHYVVPSSKDGACREKLAEEYDLLRTLDEFEWRYAYGRTLRKMTPADSPYWFWKYGGIRLSYEVRLLRDEVVATFADLALRGFSLEACGAQYGGDSDMRATLLICGGELTRNWLRRGSRAAAMRSKPYNDMFCCNNGRVDWTVVADAFNSLVAELAADVDMRPWLYNYVMHNSRVKVAVTSYRPRFTPDNIACLGYDEVFVFGSNLQGVHHGGAARVAFREFGAVMGQGVGLQGQSYAIPTMQGGVDTIRPYVDEFVRFADSHRELVFYVTRIGCGIAGFSDVDIAPLFAAARYMDNVILPRRFCEVIDIADMAGWRRG